MVKCTQLGSPFELGIVISFILIGISGLTTAVPLLILFLLLEALGVSNVEEIEGCCLFLELPLLEVWQFSSPDSGKKLFDYYLVKITAYLLEIL